MLEKTLTLTATADRPLAHMSECEVVALATLIAAERAEDDTSRAPADVVCVLDRSGSMSGHKLELCLQTLTFLIGNVLGAQDRFGLVAFDTDVSVVVPLLVMNQANKESALARVRKVTAGSSTNLSGGLFAGIEQMLSSGSASISTILCLTDGMMNHGVTDKPKLFAMLKSQLDAFPSSRTKPSIYCFGYGSDCDADCLASIASSTGGAFYSVLSLESVGAAFADVLGGVLATSAQSISLTCELTSPAEFAGEALTDFSQTRTSSSQIRVDIKDMFAGERRDLLFKIKMPKGADTIKIKFALKYLDFVLECKVEDESVNLVVPRTAEDIGPMNVEVGRQLARYQVGSSLAEATEHARRGSFKSGQDVVRDALGKTRQMMQELHITEEDAMMIELCQDLKQTETNMSSSSMWRAGGEQQTLQFTEGHSHQRSNKVSSLDSMQFGVANTVAPQSSYQTKSANAMMSKAAAFFSKKS